MNNKHPAGGSLINGGGNIDGGGGGGSSEESLAGHLIWKERERKPVFSCPVFSVTERLCISPSRREKVYTVLEASDWAIVIPVLESGPGRKFIMVRQWRHGAGELSLEFPGGVFESGERDIEAAGREMREETGYDAGRIIKLGDFNPNPAIMANRVHFFLAEDLKPLEGQNLDEDEYVDVEIVPQDEVIRGMGKAPYIHALMGTAIALYLRHSNLRF